MQLHEKLRQSAFVERFQTIPLLEFQGIWQKIGQKPCESSITEKSEL